MKFFNIIIAILFLVISGCSSQSQLIRKYEIIYEPVKSDGTIMYYIAGFPFGAYGTDKYSIIFNVQPSSILENNFLTLWLLYKNTDDKEYLLEPTKIVKMSLWQNGIKKYDVMPESPVNILTEIEETKQQDLITTSIAGAFNTITAKSERSADNAIDKAERKLSDVKSWYDLYSESISNGILRKNTIFRDKSINGLIYFYAPEGVLQPYKLHGQVYKNEDSFDFAKYDISISIQLPDGVKEFRFRKVAGE
jgi:hypothetical protein